MSKPRPGSDHAAELFRQGTVSDFEHSLSTYKDCVEKVAIKKKKKDLPELNEWWTTELPSKDHIVGKDLSDICKFKLTRGKMRPIQAIVDSNPDRLVVETSRRAFAMLKLGKWKEALDTLSDFKGVGVATASFIVAPLCPSDCPAMVDEALEAVGLSRDYTLSVYLLFRKLLMDKAQWLNSNSAKGQRHWDAETVGKALWSQATRSALGMCEGAQERISSAKKRSRPEESGQGNSASKRSLK